MFNRREIKIESLERQLEFFEALESRHLAWAGDMNDPEIKEMHFEVIELIKQTKDIYTLLLGAYYKDTR